MDLSPGSIIVRLVIGTAVGFCVGMTGIGSGALIMPILTLGLGIPPTVAVGTASLYSFLTKIYASLRHFQLKTVDFAVTAYFLIGALPADYAAARWITSHIRHAANPVELAAFQLHLKTFIGIVVCLSGSFLIYWLLYARNHIAPTDADRQPMSTPRKALCIAVGVLVGILVGSTAVIGVLIVPAMIIVFRLSPTRTVGTSTVISLFLTLVTAAIYGLGGETDFVTAGWMSLGSLVGVHFGTRMTTRLPDVVLKICVTLLIMIAGLAMLWR
ncbi:MAG: sulfite exporter TauE/SafE family protein [Verrucomicrobia bacterium]|nr:sulfite exporter TauE/SafE family protein [Verrucomicrobiota bacterium]